MKYLFLLLFFCSCYVEREINVFSVSVTLVEVRERLSPYGDAKVLIWEDVNKVRYSQRVSYYNTYEVGYHTILHMRR